MEIIPLIPERDVATQRARVAQNRDVQTQAKACLLLGRYYKEQGELDKTEVLYQRALAKARQWQAHDMEADACSGLGLMYRLAEAEDIVKKGIEIEERLQRDVGLGHHYGVLGGVYRQAGRFDEAEEIYRRTLAIQRKLGNKQFEARTIGGLGQVLRKKGDLPEAVALFQQARVLFDATGDNKGQAVQAALLGDAYMDDENFKVHPLGQETPANYPTPLCRTAA